MLLLEKDIIKKRQVDKNAIELAKLDVGNNENNKYKVKAICNSAIYARELAGHLLEFYYLFF